MPDPHRIKGELEALYSQPRYATLLARLNAFRNLKYPAQTAVTLAEKAANDLVRGNGMLNPVEVLELKGPVRLYRGHDGGSRLHSAGTLGRYWMEHSIAEEIWRATARYPASDRFKWFMEFLRAANFVLPDWNGMRSIACMSVPAGSSVVLARGRGNWKAMQTSPGVTRPAGNIRTQADVMSQVGMMPIPGLLQCFVPLFDDKWVQPLLYPSPRWFQG